MGVNIDKARRHQFALGVDLFPAFGGNLADLGDAAVRDRDIGFVQFTAEPIGDVAAADHEVWVGSPWIDSHGVHPDLDLVGGIIGRRPMLSTAGDGAQGCILFVAGRPGSDLGIPVGEKRQHNRQNHEEGGDAKHPTRRTLVHDPAK